MGGGLIEISYLKREKLPLPKGSFKIRAAAAEAGALPSASSGPHLHSAVRQSGTGGPSPGEQGV